MKPTFNFNLSLELFVGSILAILTPVLYQHANFKIVLFAVIIESLLHNTVLCKFTVRYDANLVNSFNSRYRIQIVSTLYEVRPL